MEVTALEHLVYAIFLLFLPKVTSCVSYLAGQIWFGTDAEGVLVICYL